MCCCDPQGRAGAADESDSSSVEAEQYRHPFVDGHDQVRASVIPAGSPSLCQFGDQEAVFAVIDFPFPLLDPITEINP